MRRSSHRGWFWPRRIGEAVLGLAAGRAFGVHPSLLPRWRGPDPYFWAIASGDTTTGVTLHRLAPDYDTGEVVERRAVDIAPTDDASSLARKLDRPALELLVRAAGRLERAGAGRLERAGAGDDMAGTPQREADATWAPRPSEADRALEWTRDAATLARIVRAAAKEPGAGARLGDHEVDVLEARVFASAVPAALRVGEGFGTPEGLVIRTGRGGLLLTRVRTAEDGRSFEGAAVVELARPTPGT